MKNVSDFAKKFLLAGLGAAAFSKEEIEKIAGKLAAKGELSKSEAIRVINNLAEKGKSAQSDISKLVRQEFEKILRESAIASKKDVDEIKKRLSLLEKKLAR